MKKIKRKNIVRSSYIKHANNVVLENKCSLFYNKLSIKILEVECNYFKLRFEENKKIS